MRRPQKRRLVPAAGAGEVETLRATVTARESRRAAGAHFLRKRSSRTTSPPPADLSVGLWGGFSAGFSAGSAEAAGSGLAGAGTAGTVVRRGLPCTAALAGSPPPLLA